MNRSTPYQQQFAIQLGQESVLVNMQLSARKSLRLQLNKSGEIDLKIPIGLPKAQVLAFLNKNQSWLVEQREHFAQQQQTLLEHFYHHGNRVKLIASVTPKLQVLEESWHYPMEWAKEELFKHIDSFLREQAYQEYQKTIDRWWPAFSAFGSKPTLRVKKMRTRWGSLSKRGYINLNLALVSLPYELQELVIVHELCHLKYFNHGKEFKALMQQCLPDFKEREKQLSRWEKVVLHRS